ncbi:MAG TPA: SpoIIE family protein phosphatase, partial [Mycobacteriales bacterium]|nr:SpoIIE family protein phosphatase [Mycobacteriales bacterium]
MAEAHGAPVWDSPHLRDGRRRLASAIDALDPMLPVPAIARIAVEHVVGALGALSGGCWLLSDDGAALELVANLSATDTTRTANARLGLDADSVVARAARAGEGLFIPAGTADVVGAAAPDRGIIALPMIGHDEVAGVIAVSVDGSREASRADLAFGVTLAQLCAGAIRRARLSDDARNEPGLVLADQLRFSSEASALLAESLEVDRVADVLAHLAVPRLGGAAAVYLTGDDGAVIAAVAHTEPEREPYLLRMLRTLPITTEQDIGPGAVLRTGRTEHLPALSEEAVAEMLRRFPAVAAAIGAVAPRTGLLVPLVARGRVNGVLALARDEPEYSGADLLLAEELGRRGALAVDNARLYARERDAAVTLQRSLLPPALPDLPGLSVAARYLPGTAGTEAGGDWYDVIPLPHGRVGLAIGDVMGRGLRAAAVMGQVSAALRAYALEGSSPSQLLARLDRVVTALHGTSLTTCAYAVFDPATGALRLALAGHPPPLRVLFAGDGAAEAEYVDVEPGLPLGVETSDYPEAALALPRGGALVLYTDGLVESRNGGLDPGLDRLRDVARTPRPDDRGMATALADDIVTTLSEHRDEGDDTALLVLVRETALVATWDLPETPDGAGMARREITSVIDAWGLAALRDDVVLLVSELVTNALRHARPPVRLHAEADDRRLRIGVDDGGAAVVLRPRLFPPAEQENGRGLALLETLSSRWGMVARPDGKTVWFELDRPAVTA